MFLGLPRYIESIIFRFSLRASSANPQRRASPPILPLYPPSMDWLRSLICHADLLRLLAIYDDRLEIWSVGGLPTGITIEELKRQHKSVLRNPSIADVLYKRGLVERWGIGTQTIVELCVENGYPEPDSREQAGSVGVLFYIGTAADREGATGAPSPREEEVLRILAAQSPLSTKDIMVKMDGAPSARTLKRDLNHLKELGLVKMVGRGPGSRWGLIGPDRVTSGQIGPDQAKPVQRSRQHVEEPKESS